MRPFVLRFSTNCSLRERSIEYLCEKLSINPLGLWNLFHQEPRFEEYDQSRKPILYTDLDPLWDSEKLRRCIERGEPLDIIARDLYECETREFARQQIAARNLSDYRNARSSLRRRLSPSAPPDEISLQRADLLNVLFARSSSLASDAERKAIRHFLGGSSRTPLAKLVRVYQGIESGRFQGLTPTEIAESLGMRYSNLYDLMERAPANGLWDIRRSAGRADYTVLAPRFDACVTLGFSVRSIESFLGRRLALYKPKVFSKRHTDYHSLSQIYEAADAGFAPDETAKVLGLPGWRVRDGLLSRSGFEPKIVQGLRILFQDPTITKPYVSTIAGR